MVIAGGYFPNPDCRGFTQSDRRKQNFFSPDILPSGTCQSCLSCPAHLFKAAYKNTNTPPAHTLEVNAEKLERI